MQLAVLGSGVAPPSPARGAPALALRTELTAWLFDCGDDTQRQLGRQSAVRHGRVNAFFVTSRAGGGALGLPGMLCIASAARDIARTASPPRGRGRGRGRDRGPPPRPPPPSPVAVFAPPGVADFLAASLTLSDTFLGMPVCVHELAWGAGADLEPSPRGGALAVRSLLCRRARLSGSRLAPDRLNPHGHHDVGTPPSPASARAQEGLKRRGVRAPARLPAAGDPGLDPDPAASAWTLALDDSVIVTAHPLGGGEGGAGPDSVLYVVREAARAGRLDAAAALAAGVPSGPAMGSLKSGLPVTLEDGTVFEASRFVGPDVPGRVVAVAGDAPPGALAAAAPLFRDADILVASAADAAGAGAAAGAARVGCLVLARFPAGSDPDAAVAAATAAAAAVAGDQHVVTVIAASDLDLLSVERRERVAGVGEEGG
jgi:ribonuclease Z